jgi:hypothetical protein
VHFSSFVLLLAMAAISNLDGDSEGDLGKKMFSTSARSGWSDFMESKSCATFDRALDLTPGNLSEDLSSRMRSNMVEIPTVSSSLSAVSGRFS